MTFHDGQKVQVIKTYTKMMQGIYRLFANKTEDLINERKIDFACVSK